jgi:nitrite reductase/ring-hydroxylating ferredoxin subunit
MRVNSSEGNIHIFESLSNKGANSYDALNNQCPHKSVAVLLEPGEDFFDKHSLQKIVDEFQKQTTTYIMATGVRINGTNQIPSPEILNFKRFNYAFQL